MKDKFPRKLTKEERAAVQALERLQKNWPKTLMLFGSTGALYVLDLASANEHTIHYRKGTLEEWKKKTVIARIAIYADGGDPW